MQLLRSRFTIRSLIIAVAVVGTNLAGVIATSRYYPRQPNVARSKGYLKRYTSQYADGTIEIGRGQAGEPGRIIERVMLRPYTPTTQQVWSPVIASVCATILVLVVPRWGRRTHSIGNVQLARFRLAARWLLIVVALVGLNLSATNVFRPPLRFIDEQLQNSLISAGELLAKADGSVELRPVGGVGLFKPDGGYEFQPAPPVVLVKADRPVEHRGPSEARVPFAPNRDDPGRILGTIVYKPDGSIVGYEGTPGQMQPPSHLIRPPVRSFLEMRWQLIGSASITGVALLVLFYQALRSERA
jgi:hypothetical protein